MLREKLTTSLSLHHSYGDNPPRHSPISHSWSILVLTPQASRSTLAHSHSHATYYCSASPRLCTYIYMYSCQPHKLTCTPLNSIGSHQEHPPLSLPPTPLKPSLSWGHSTLQLHYHQSWPNASSIGSLSRFRILLLMIHPLVSLVVLQHRHSCKLPTFLSGWSASH